MPGCLHVTVKTKSLLTCKCNITPLTSRLPICRHVAAQQLARVPHPHACFSSLREDSASRSHSWKRRSCRSVDSVFLPIYSALMFTIFALVTICNLGASVAGSHWERVACIYAQKCITKQFETPALDCKMYHIFIGLYWIDMTMCEKNRVAGASKGEAEERIPVLLSCLLKLRACDTSPASSRLLTRISKCASSSR